MTIKQQKLNALVKQAVELDNNDPNWLQKYREILYEIFKLKHPKLKNPFEEYILKEKPSKEQIFSLNNACDNYILYIIKNKQNPENKPILILADNSIFNDLVDKLQDYYPSIHEAYLSNDYNLYSFEAKPFNKLSIKQKLNALAFMNCNPYPINI